MRMMTVGHSGTGDDESDIVAGGRSAKFAGMAGRCAFQVASPQPLLVVVLGTSSINAPIRPVRCALC